MIPATPKIQHAPRSIGAIPATPTIQSPARFGKSVRGGFRSRLQFGDSGTVSEHNNNTPSWPGGPVLTVPDNAAGFDGTSSSSESDDNDDTGSSSDTEPSAF